MAERWLLSAGTGKTGATVFHFSVPAVRACPGRSRLCTRVCYARTGRFRYPKTQERLAWAFEQSKRADFADRLSAELYRRGVLACRWFVSGDVYSPSMARKMAAVVERSPFCRFVVYTRSWRVPAIAPHLRPLAALPNVVVHYSCDAETGLPEEVPDGVRVAWLHTAADDAPSGAGIDLLFRTRDLRAERVPLPLAGVVCPHETPEGKARGVTCATYGICLTKG